MCTPRVSPSSPEEHYRAVCRALTTESIELRVFLSKILTNDTEALRIKADAQSSRQELAKLDFRDWVSFIFLMLCDNFKSKCDKLNLTRLLYIFKCAFTHALHWIKPEMHNNIVWLGWLVSIKMFNCCCYSHLLNIIIWEKKMWKRRRKKN